MVMNHIKGKKWQYCRYCQKLFHRDSHHFYYCSVTCGDNQRVQDRLVKYFIQSKRFAKMDLQNMWRLKLCVLPIDCQ